MQKRKHPQRRPPRPRPRERGPQSDRRGPRGSAGGGTWLYGLHTVAAALANPARNCQRLVIAAQSAATLESALAEAAAAGGHPFAPEIRDRREVGALLAPEAVHQGVALLTDPLPDADLADICAGLADAPAAVVVVLDQATDPRNVGAVLRAAAAFGAAAVVVQDRHAPDATALMAKAASGALEKVPLVRVTNISRALDDLKEAGFWCTGLDGQAEQSLAGAAVTGRTALVLGSEGAGLRRLVRERCDRLVRIPITSTVESLNLATAAAVALYELARESES